MSKNELSSKRIIQLLKAEKLLNALEAGGVDNWEGYDESLKDLRKEEEIDNLVVDTIYSIMEEVCVNASVEYPARTA